MAQSPKPKPVLTQGVPNPFAKPAQPVRTRIRQISPAVFQRCSGELHSGSALNNHRFNLVLENRKRRPQDELASPQIVF